VRRLLLVAALAACGNDIDLGETMVDAAPEPDPLAVPSTAAPGSLDDIHGRILAKRCSGQPGLCHNGQFEPNLSTPALTYAYLVNRPGIEKPDRLRVAPGDAAKSLFIDKIRNRNGVATQMPLGAEPLADAEVAELEAWIAAGAKRSPDAAPAPVLNNPPRRPQIAVFSPGGARLDNNGPLVVRPGDTIELVHTVSDFETRDADMPFTAVILSLGDGRNIVLTTAPDDGHLGPTTYDAGGPPAQGDVFNFVYSWTVPPDVGIRSDADGSITMQPAAGTTAVLIALYFDQVPTMGGIVAFDVGPTIQIEANP